MAFTDHSSRPHRLRGAVVITSVALVTLGLAACSTDNGGGGATSGKTYAIGLPLPLTGSWASGGTSSAHGALLAIHDINAAGGIKSLDGAKLKGVTGDSGSTDPNQAGTVTNQLVDQDGAVALMGSYVTAFTTTASTAAEQAGVPLVTVSNADTLSQRGYENYFQVSILASESGSSVVKYLKDAYESAGTPVKDVAVLASNDATTQAQGQTVIDQAKSDGIQVVNSAFFPQDLSDATVMVQSALAEHPDAILLGGPTPAVATIVQTARTLGFKGPLVGLGGGGILDPEFGKQIGDSVNGVLSMSSWNFDLPYKGIDKFKADYQAKYGEFPSQEAGESYVAIWDIAEAMNAAKSADPAKIASALHSTDFTTGGASWMPGGKVKFDKTGHNSEIFPIMIQWQNGAPCTVWPKQVQACQPQ